MNRGRRADQIVGLCRERLDRGECVDPEEVIRAHPDLERILRPRLAALALLASGSARADAKAERIGPYRVLRELGQGAQGTVFLAEDTRLPRRVALKVFAPGLVPSARFLGRVRREAETASRLDHPGICTVYDAAVESDTPYIAMRYVDGRTLHEWIADARANAKDRATTTTGVDLPAPPNSPTQQGVMRVVALVEKAARALHAAHEAGVVHRDVKPGNILVTREGEPVLVDFGLAQEDEGGRTLTATGALVGTPAYMSPEQLLGGEVRLDARTDVYSLGVTLYECLTLGLPFEGPTREALYRRVLTSSAESPRRRNPHVPRDLEIVVETAMQKSREGRYATALDFAEDLRRLRMHEPIRARATPAWVRLARLARRHPASSTAVVATFVLLATGLTITVHFLDRSVEEQRRTAAALEATTTAGEHARSLALCGASALAIPVDGVRALLLAREAVRAQPSVAAFNQLRRALYHSVERAELPSQADGVVAAAFSPQGDRIVFAAGIWTHVCDIHGRPIASLGGHGAPVRAVVFSPSGDRIVTASDDGDARLWETSGALIKVLTGHTNQVLWAAFSPTGDRIVTTSSDKTARLWGADGGPLAVLAEHGEAVRYAEFSPSGDQIVTASDDATARVWSRDGRRLAVLAGHKGRIREAHFSPRGDAIVTVSSDHTARIWETSGTVRAILEGHTDEVIGAAFSPTGDRVATASNDLTARIWDLAGRETVPSMWHNEVVWSPRFSPTGDRLLTYSNDRSARVWDRSGRLVAVMRGHEDQVIGAALSPRGDSVVTASADGTARVWASAESELALMTGHTAAVRSAAYSPDGRRIVTASDDGTSRVWDRDGDQVLVLHGGVNRMISAAYSPQGNLIVTTGSNGTAQLWDPQGAKLAALEGHAGMVRWAAFSPDGGRVVTACQDGKARVFDVSGNLLFTFAGHEGQVAMGRFSPDGSLVVTASRDRTARVWDLSGKLHAVLRGHDNSLLSAAWSPRGDRIVTASRDRTARIWTSSGEPLVVLQGHDNIVLTAEFSPDGERVVTASTDGTVRLWNLAGDEIAAIEGCGAAFTCAAFSPEGDCIVTSSIDGTARTWLVAESDLLALAERRSTREFTRREREIYADILGPDNADALKAHEAIATLSKNALLVAEIVEGIDADASLPSEVRDAAKRLLARRTDEPLAINRAAWEIVSSPAHSAQEYRLALRRIEVACALAPANGNLVNTLAAAQYRVGRFDEALATLEKSEAIHVRTRSRGLVDDYALRAMCLRRTGDAVGARDCIARLREHLKSHPGRPKQSALVAEAEAACAK